jgi:hypothetical protein
VQRRILEERRNIMKPMRKRDVRRAVVRAREMLERNAPDSCDTFEGVLGRGYVRTLRTLVLLGEEFLAPRKALRG